MANSTIHIQELTRLPVKEIRLVDRVGSDLRLMTPHKGEVIINLKEESFGLFGGGVQYDRHAEEVIEQIRELERESITYFFDQWKESLPKEIK